MTAFIFDESRWPLLILRFPHEYSHREFVEHTAQMREYMRGTETFVLLTDARDSQAPNALQRKLMAEVIDAESSADLKLIAVAVLVSSSTMAALLTAFSWIVRPPYPLRNFHDEAEAQKWLQEQLSATSVALTQ